MVHCVLVHKLNPYWYPTSHRYSVIVQHWSNYRFWQTVPLYNVLVLSNLCGYRHKSHIAKN